MASNSRVNNVLDMVKNIPSEGEFEQFEDLPYYANIAVDHIQGYGRGTIAGKTYYVLTHSLRNKDEGRIIFSDNLEGDHIEIHAPDGVWHPAGVQFIGDYAFVSSSGRKAHVYDVCKVMNKQTTEPVATYSVRGGTCLGIADFYRDSKHYYLLMMVESQDTCVAYIAEDTGDIAKLTFEEKGSYYLENHNYTTQGIGLVTDINENVFMIVTEIRGEGTTYGDYINLYPLCIGSDMSVVVKDSQRVVRHLVNKGGLAGVDGSHFRWGPGIEVTSDGTINVLTTSRNIIAGTHLNTTVWKGKIK